MAEAEQALRDAEAAVGLIEPTYREAERHLRRLETATDEFVLAVLRDEHSVALERLTAAREGFVQAEADVRGLLAAVSEHGRRDPSGGALAWLKLAEVFAETWAKAPRLETSNAHMHRARIWSGLIERLASGDAGAMHEEVGRP